MKKGVLTKEDTEKILKSLDGSERIREEASLSWDGRNLLLRLPKEIANYLGVDDKNRFEKKLFFKIEEKNGEVKKEFGIVNREEPKREVKKHAKK